MWTWRVFSTDAARLHMADEKDTEFHTNGINEQDRKPPKDPASQRESAPPPLGRGSEAGEKRDDDGESIVGEEVMASSRNEDESPDGGYGWVVVGCCFVINMHTWGLNSSYGVFLDHYLRSAVFPGGTPLEFAYVGGLSISAALFISPLATTTTRLYGTHATLLTGVFFETASFIGASFATRMWQLFLSQGACFGLGMGFLFAGSVTVTPAWFSRRRSLAMGIVASGSGFGGLVYSLLAGALIEGVGLAWTFRALGAIALAANLAAVLLIRDRNKEIGATLLAFDWRMFRRGEFLLFQAFGVLSMFAYVVVLFSLPNFATKALGLTPRQGSVVGAVLNLGQALGRPPIGYFSDTLGRLNMAGLMTLLPGLLCLLIWVFTNSYSLLLFFALVGGMVAGTFWAVVAPVGAEVVGMRQLASALSITWVVLVLPCTFSEPIGLAIVKGNDGAYLGAQLFAGWMYVGAAAAMVLLRAWKIGELEGKKAEKQKGQRIHGDEPQQQYQLNGAEEEMEKQAKAGPQTSFLSRLVRMRRV